MDMGDMANDGGNKAPGLLFTIDEYKRIIEQYPETKQYFKKHVGTKEYMSSTCRYCLWIGEKEYNLLKKIPAFKNRFINVYKHRQSSSDKGTNNLATTPFKFRDTKIAREYTIVVPKVNTVGRLYIPAGLLTKDYIISDLMFGIYDGPIWVLGLILSRLHYVWIKASCGKEGKSYRYSKNLGYNTFPVPHLSNRRKKEIEGLVLKILDIRDEEEGTLNDLYGSPLAEKNPKPMNPRLLKAHQELDQVVDRAYKPNGFRDDNERLALLLDMYSKKVNENESTN